MLEIQLRNWGKFWKLDQDGIPTEQLRFFWKSDQDGIQTEKLRIFWKPDSNLTELNLSEEKKSPNGEILTMYAEKLLCLE